jgi:hypothetical protein
VGDDAPLVPAEDERLRPGVVDLGVLEAADALGLHLAELPQALNGLADGLPEPVLAEAGVLAFDQELRAERQVVASRLRPAARDRPAASSLARLMRRPEERRSKLLPSLAVLSASRRWAFKAAMLLLSATGGIPCRPLFPLTVSRQTCCDQNVGTFPNSLEWILADFCSRGSCPCRGASVIPAEARGDGLGSRLTAVLS